MPGIHLNFLIILVLAIIATTAAGMLIGVPTLRLRGDYVGIVTLAFGEIIAQVVSNGREIEFLGGSLTGGPNGIVRHRQDRPAVHRALRGAGPASLVLVRARARRLALFVNFRLRDSRMGRAWIALRDDEHAAASAGIPIMRTKLLAYGVGAALGGVSGAFLASYLSFVNPNQFTFSFSIFILAMVVLGGRARSGASSSARSSSRRSTTTCCPGPPRRPGAMGLDFDLSEISGGLYGFLLVIIMLLRPQGLLPARRHSFTLPRRTSRTLRSTGY